MMLKIIAVIGMWIGLWFGDLNLIVAIGFIYIGGVITDKKIN